MSISIVTTFDAPDPSVEFTTPTAFVNLLNELVESTSPTEITTYVKGSAIPAVDDQDKAWIRVAPDGTPYGTYVYKSGFWIREPPLLGARIGIYAGNPTIDFDVNSSGETFGRGLKGDGPVAADAYGWALMNGHNGTADISNRFIIAASMDDLVNGYNGGWRTGVTGSVEAVGGAASITLDGSTTFNAAADALTVGKWKADGGQSRGGTSDDTFPLYGIASESDDTKNLDIILADAGTETPDPISIVPPFFALAYVQWIGQTY